MPKRPVKRIKAPKSPGNVFADLGLPEPGTELLKAQLTLRIWKALTQTGASQAEAARQLGLKQPDISRLMNARPTRFSAERLMRILAALGHDVTITISPAAKRNRVGNLKVAA